jgi:hypothetical protein
LSAIGRLVLGRRFQKMRLELHLGRFFNRYNRPVVPFGGIKDE